MRNCQKSTPFAMLKAALWRSIKDEEIYLRAYASVHDARAGIERYINFYDTRRPHSSLDRQTPDQAYFNALQPIPVAV